MKRAYFFIPFCAIALALAACGSNSGGGLPFAHPGGSVSPVQSATPTPAGSPPGPMYDFGYGNYENNVERTCPDVATLPRGKKTCFALVRTDLGGGSKGAYHGTDFVRAQREFVAGSASATPNPITNTGNAAPYGPAALQAAYNLPSTTAGAGQTIAIVDAWDDPFAESDLAVYRSNFNLPPCTTANGCFKKVNETGEPAPLPSPDPGWAGEISLDLDMASAVCPNCKIMLVEVSTDFDKAENTAVSLGAKYISNSYGGNETAQTDSAYDSHPGVVITASSGDSSYAAGPIDPAALQNVIGVGGTSLYQDSTNSRGWTEVAWHGAGSACSQLVPRPSYQTDIGCSATKWDGKAVSDISAVADPFTGVWVYESYPAFGWTAFGGTSVSSPIIAAAYALAGNADSIGPGATSVWHAAGTSALNDVLAGINAQGGACTPAIMCVSGPGYDGPTGWGTPNGLGAL